MKKCMVTGHRPDKLGNEYDLNGPFSFYLKNEITGVLRREKPDLAISGMALGVDTLFALICINEKIPVIAALPFEGQSKVWPAKSIDLYNKILNDPLVTKYVVCPGGYAPWKMQKRNEWMSDELVEPEDFAIACWNGTKGGTANCVEYLKDTDKRIIRIDPNEATRTLSSL